MQPSDLRATPSDLSSSTLTFPIESDIEGHWGVSTWISCPSLLDYILGPQTLEFPARLPRSAFKVCVGFSKQT